MLFSKRKWTTLALILALAWIALSAVVWADPAQTDNDQDGLTGRRKTRWAHRIVWSIPTATDCAMARLLPPAARI